MAEKRGCLAPLLSQLYPLEVREGLGRSSPGRKSIKPRNQTRSASCVDVVFSAENSAGVGFSQAKSAQDQQDPDEEENPG